MRAEAIGPYTAGGWRVARKAFTCVEAYGQIGGKGCRGVVTIAEGEEYYDTREGSGFHTWATRRLCRACAEHERARYAALPGVTDAG